MTIYEVWARGVDETVEADSPREAIGKCGKYMNVLLSCLYMCGNNSERPSKRTLEEGGLFGPAVDVWVREVPGKSWTRWRMRVRVAAVLEEVD